MIDWLKNDRDTSFTVVDRIEVMKMQLSRIVEISKKNSALRSKRNCNR